ncbi:hypothetical protein AB1Y20_000057 [Prymnesium parvum]|uniref:DNA polymerase n=1 Tax=Prymnesium parvum TaxID=97485 RepID=A0AB34K7D2_PRYPA
MSSSVTKRASGPPGHVESKRARTGEDDDDMDDIDDMIEEEEDIMNEELLAAAGQPPEEADIACIGEKDVAAMANMWKRPDLPEFKADEDSISFQQLECDYSVMPLVTEFDQGSNESRAAVIRLFGVTKEGHSVVAHVHGFKPYFFVRAPPGFTPQDIPQFQATLNAKIKAGLAARDQCTSPVAMMEIVRRQSIMHYAFKEGASFIRIVTALPSLVATCRRLLEQGIAVPRGGCYQFETYESNCVFALRFMVDRGIMGCSWVTCPGDKWRARPWQSSDGRSMERTTHCQLELDLHFADLVSHQPDGEWLDIAPMRILSFDIECAGRPGIFPEADKDPVIQIANHVTLQGSSKPIVKNVFTLKECAPISGAQVLSFDTEHEMLRAWHQFVLDTDADILTGYNIVNFDLPYLLNRASALKITTFPFLGRLKGIASRMKDKLFQSKQVGTRESKEINIEGRVQFDVLQILQRDAKLASYSLNAVCAHYLGEQKEDVHHSIISDLQSGNAETRRRLAVYCLKDAYLPQRLLQKLMCVVNYVEMARVTGVPLSYLLTRGQQIKVMSQLYRKARTLGLLLPVASRKVTEGEKFEGATVIEPVKGYYKDHPIATLDFASLYPSIMMAHNLCYSTLVRRQDIQKLDESQYAKSPTGAVFVKSETHKGILPLILEELLAARKNAKKLMKQEKDPFKYAVYDGRQLALKISANSVYGFTGAQVGQLPCLEISSTVTAYGRQMIESTKLQVETRYTRANGYDFDAQVIYGDTDSVMIKFGTESLAKAMELGQEAADEVTKSFISPIKLEFEKCYHPYLLMNKKRYAGLLWTNTNKYDKMDCKGIETVRRDNCMLVKEVVDTSLRSILINKDPEGAINYVKSSISSLLLNKMDLSKLVITKALTRTEEQYEAGNKQAHVTLAARIKKRDPGMAPAVGDRVPYVMIKGPAGAKAADKAEDPIYVLENNIPIDTTWYLEHQLSEPIRRLFEPVLPDNVESLLKGDHTRSIHKATPTTGGLMKFAKVSLQCLGCKTILKGEEKALCHNCKSKEVEIYYSKLSNVQDCEQLFSRLWTQCQRCQGDLHKDVLCTSRDCPIFYKRKKVQKELKDASETLLRFGESGLEW